MQMKMSAAPQLVQTICQLWEEVARLPGHQGQDTRASMEPQAGEHASPWASLPLSASQKKLSVF